MEKFEVAGEGEAALGADGATVPAYCFTFTCGDSVIRPCAD